MELQEALRNAIRQDAEAGAILMTPEAKAEFERTGMLATGGAERALACVARLKELDIDSGSETLVYKCLVCEQIKYITKSELQGSDGCVSCPDAFCGAVCAPVNAN